MKIFIPDLERWFILTSEGIGYMNQNKKQSMSFREYNIYPKDFSIKFDNK